MDDKKHQIKKDFRNQAIKKEARQLKARQNKEVNAWWGFSLFGLVGWSVVAPALIGIFVGMWLEHHYACSNTWTLGLMLAGVIMGTVFALILLGREMFNKKDD